MLRGRSYLAVLCYVGPLASHSGLQLTLHLQAGACTGTGHNQRIGSHFLNEL